MYGLLSHTVGILQSLKFNGIKYCYIAHGENNNPKTHKHSVLYCSLVLVIRIIIGHTE